MTDTDKEYLVEKLLSGTEAWNQWRRDNPTQGSLDLTQVNLSGAKLSGADLSKADLSGANLSGADLSKARLYGASLKNANLISANLTGTILNYATSIQTELNRSSLCREIFRSVASLTNNHRYELSREQNDLIIKEIHRYDSSRTNLRNANHQNINWPSAELESVIFNKANLREANLYGVILFRADLSEADLSEADLRYAILNHANLRKTIISKKTKINSRWRRISFLLNNQAAKPYHWRRADLKFADLEGVDLSEAELPFANLRGANLYGANLVGTNLYGAQISDANLEGVTYSETTILPPLYPMQQQSLISVNPPLELESNKKEILVDLESLKDERRRTNVERIIRKGQRKFRAVVLDAFQGKCAITACDVGRALDAAHIFPYRGQKTDCLWNGILLRLDLHRLFDSYLLSIDPLSGQVYLESSLKNSYGGIANTKVCFPEEPVSENRKQALRWHKAQCSWLEE
ncbi:MAG TPA: pentapeptide repeat-containing protein [Phormidium sp.]